MASPSKLTETMLVANLALRTGRKIDWDAEAMEARGCPEASPFIRRRVSHRMVSQALLGGDPRNMAGKVKVGIIGSQFEADIHAASFQIMPEEAEVVAVASPTPGHPEALAQRYGIPRVFHDYRQMLAEPDIEMVTIAAPNALHAQMTIDAADAGKHVVCEKPLCMTLEEADQMIDVCRRQGVLADVRRGALLHPQVRPGQADGRRGGLRQGPPGQAEREAFRAARRLVLGREQVRRRRVHGHGLPRHRLLLLVPGPAGDQGRLLPDGHLGPRRQDPGRGRVPLHPEFEGGAVGLVENSWARPGGMDDRVEVYGSAGLTYANLHMGNALPTYSETGYGYAVEKAPSTKGWSYPVYEELWNYGFPQEMHHFARCVRGKETPIATGEDGRVVQEVLLAGYRSARIGAKVGAPLPARRA